ncbi:MAG: iron-sulfur cluster carrier protein ApbC [Methylomonas sp.]|jgi:ATP-binding protein involved in chromosome partitioning|uniref:iron-sulfur cluster carrier protein ApbC n=1 Tax=Methylomonas sp. TaxID=418 RepID=UPI0025DD4FE4|nr:iron-sulfur cluster carrier protein ApbC [Methylomonas sp.]MCK9608760.1 iron-sulfur cluster carrier protein ApbC [Methylomonas sp.]
MTSIDKAAVEHMLKTFIDPNVATDLISAKSVKNIAIDGTDVKVTIELGYPAKSYIPLLTAQLQQKLTTLAGIGTVQLDISVNIVAHSVQKTLKPLPNVKNIIAVASGKGGVGKSTTSVNLALALAAEGAEVGILDADIYGPSIPTMLGLSGQPETLDGKFLLPKISFGVQTISIGYLVDPDQPMIWRGPMVTGALQQLLTQTQWSNLDYLIIDLPPGTGDIQLTLAQQIPLSGAVIVTTPQDIALIDAQRGLGMFEKVNVPILGLVENMSIHICSNCGHEEAIFGKGGGLAMAEKNNIELLGSLPLDINIRQQADSGRPTVAADPDSRAAEMYKAIARKMAAKLAMRARDYSSKFPNIVIQNT